MNRPGPRPTLLHLLLATLGVAVAFIAYREPVVEAALRRVAGPALVVGGLIALVVVLVGLVRSLYVSLVGVSCPSCGRRPLVLHSTSPFASRFFRCDGCGARWRRSPILATWSVASGPRDAARFQTRQGRDPWTGGPTVDDAATSSARTTQAALLRNKRLRHPGDGPDDASGTDRPGRGSP